MANTGETITVCNPTKYDMMLETNNNKVTGIFAPFIFNYMNVFLNFLNASVMINEGYPGVGQPIGGTDMYDGCLGQLQRGEADVIVAGMDYPSNIVNISQGFIAREEQVTFSGLFPRPEAVKKADFSRSLYSFHRSVYLLILAYLVLFGIICKVKSRLRRLISIACMPTNAMDHDSEGLKWLKKTRKTIERRARHSPGFVDVLRTFLGTNFIEPDSLVLTVIVLSLNLFSFFLISAYFNSLLNTDLVIPEQAVIYENYDEIMKAGAKPLFFSGMNAHRYMKFAKNGSKEKQFWDWAVGKFDEKDLMLPNTVECFQRLLPVIAGTGLIFLSDLITPLLRSTTCGVLDRSFKKLVALAPSVVDWSEYGDVDLNIFQDMQFYTRIDPSAPRKIKSLVLGRRALESPDLYSKANILFLRSFEHGHLEAAIQMNQQVELASVIPGVESLLGPVVPERSQIKQRCRKMNKAVPKIPDIDQVSLENFRFSFAFCAALMALSMLIFLGENLANKKRKN